MLFLWRDSCHRLQVTWWGNKARSCCMCSYCHKAGGISVCSWKAHLKAFLMCCFFYAVIKRVQISCHTKGTHLLKAARLGITLNRSTCWHFLPFLNDFWDLKRQACCCFMFQSCLPLPLFPPEISIWDLMFQNRGILYWNCESTWPWPMMFRSAQLCCEEAKAMFTKHAFVKNIQWWRIICYTD